MLIVDVLRVSNASKAMHSLMPLTAHVIDMQDYADLIQTHRKSNADITIATHAVGQGQASFRGCCKVEDSGQQSLIASPCRPLLQGICLSLLTMSCVAQI